MATYDKDEFMRVPYTRVCKYCGASGLEWVLSGGKYILYDKDNKKHTCAVTNALNAHKRVHKNGVREGVK